MTRLSTLGVEIWYPCGTESLFHDIQILPVHTVFAPSMPKPGSLGPFPSSPPQHLDRPLHLAQHDTMSTVHTPLYHVDHIWPTSLRRRQHHLRVGQRERLVSPTQHVRGWDVSPGCVRGLAPVDADALGQQLRGPVLRFGGAHVVIQHLGCTRGVNTYGASLRWLVDSRGLSGGAVPQDHIASTGT